MKRGDLITIAMQGAYGKPRPAVVVQANEFPDLESITFLPLSSEVLPRQVFRVQLDPSPDNGLQTPSQVMADKCSTLPRSKIGSVFGTLAPGDMYRVDRALALFLGFA